MVLFYQFIYIMYESSTKINIYDTVPLSTLCNCDFRNMDSFKIHS